MKIQETISRLKQSMIMQIQLTSIVHSSSWIDQIINNYIEVTYVSLTFKNSIRYIKKLMMMKIK